MAGKSEAKGRWVQSDDPTDVCPRDPAHGRLYYFVMAEPDEYGTMHDMIHAEKCYSCGYYHSNKER